MIKTKMNLIPLSLLLMVLLLTGCNSFGAKCSCGDPVELKQESINDSKKVQ